MTWWPSDLWSFDHVTRHVSLGRALTFPWFIATRRRGGNSEWLYWLQYCSSPTFKITGLSQWCSHYGCRWWPDTPKIQVGMSDTPKEINRVQKVKKKHTIKAMRKCIRRGPIKFLGKLVKSVTPERQILRLKCTKFDFRWGWNESCDDASMTKTKGNFVSVLTKKSYLQSVWEVITSVRSYPNRDGTAYW